MIKFTFKFSIHLFLIFSKTKPKKLQNLFSYPRKFGRKLESYYVKKEIYWTLHLFLHVESIPGNNGSGVVTWLGLASLSYVDCGSSMYDVEVLLTQTKYFSSGKSFPKKKLCLACFYFFF